jgi:hypothetical protein
MEIPKPRILLSIEKAMLKKLEDERKSLNLLTIPETVRYIIVKYFEDKE